MIFQKLLAKVLLTIAALAVVFTIGYSIGSDHEKAKQIDGLTQAQADSNREVTKSQKESIAIESRVSESTQLIEEVKKQAVERVKANEPKVITKIVTKYVGVPDDSSTNGNINSESTVETTLPWTFGNGTIRLLNTARSNDTTSTTDGDDASDQTASSVKVSDLVDNDLEVVGLYHELAERHKGLQQYLSEKQDQGYMLCKPP